MASTWNKYNAYHPLEKGKKYKIKLKSGKEKLTFMDENGELVYNNIHTIYKEGVNNTLQYRKVNIEDIDEYMIWPE